MNLLPLGTAQRRLFAIHEPAVVTGHRARAAVLCHPMGTEYTYAYRSMRQLSLRLAMSGCHTIRFDYYGTGDSGGDESETDLAGCESDVEAALEALADIAGISKVTLIGLRAGANIAANVAARRSADVDALVLWDPVEAVTGTLPDRTAVFVTAGETPPELARHAGCLGGPKPVTVEFIATPFAWIESATTTGALPVAIIQRVVEWLK
jgi:pimeloyl-ACP methyl ester carboxylesterase